MRIRIITYLIVLGGLLSCEPEADVSLNAARVNDQFLLIDEVNEAMPLGLTEEDSVLYRNNYIRMWATKQLLLEKARLNVDDKNGEIQELVQKYKEELLIERYKKALLQQELDTLITEEDIDGYYEENKNVYRLNEELMQLKYVYFSKDLSDKKEVIKMFRSGKSEDTEELIRRELEFYSFSFNDSIWVSYKEVEKKLPFLKDDKNIKKNQFIQKEDSLGVYLLAVKDMRQRNDVAPKNYVIPTIKQMILHRRRLELMNDIERTIVIDAINDKQFEQY